MKSKKITAAIFATISAMVATAVSMDVVPAHYHKLMVYIVAALAIVGNTLLPAVIDEVGGEK